jgi:hypothetical protein
MLLRDLTAHPEFFLKNSEIAPESRGRTLSSHQKVLVIFLSVYLPDTMPPALTFFSTAA